jgi:hypothetical protein
MKLKDIILGWKNLIFTSPEIKKMAAEREAICAKCEHASKTIYLHCNLCGCYIPAKTRSKDSSCPDGRWPLVLEKNEQ